MSATAQIAYLDHVLVVVDAETAAAIAESDTLRALGRLDVATVDSDGESWTGRYLSGRRTYVEVFGPGDYADGAPGATGLGLSTRTQGDLAGLLGRAAAAGHELETGRRTGEEDGRTVPWFDHAAPSGSGRTFDVWVMEFLREPGDLERRESAYVEWTARAERDDRSGPFLGEVVEVELGVPADDVALAGPVLEAAGFDVTRSADLVVARDTDTLIRMHVVPGHAAWVRRIGFTLTGEAGRQSTFRIGRSTLVVGPADRADWTFDQPEQRART